MIYNKSIDTDKKRERKGRNTPHLWREKIDKPTDRAERRDKTVASAVLQPRDFFQTQSKRNSFIYEKDQI